MVTTRHGPVECAVMGDGPPVLVIHGAGGGFDQGMDFAAPLLGAGFQVIAPSRFGYLRTPLPADASPAAQADAHASLLDALNVRRAIVLGFSAGGPSAMQFALRYPDRTAALVLAVPAAYPSGVEQRPDGAAPKRIPAAVKLVLDAALKSDFLFWAAQHAAPHAMMRAVLGTPPALVETATADERARAAAVMEHILPITARRHGLLNDAAITPFLPRYDLERIAAPTVIMSVPDDLYGTFAGARYSAEHIPDARFVTYPSGGHLMIGHQQESTSEIVTFLKELATARRRPSASRSSAQ